ncbi:hypothetical protein JL49_13195 [Pseudoalteromonas luteoviolacea]|nr:hypothetical protein JL49_13195 [Pseudoalteromonas luteoviolacea]
MSKEIIQLNDTQIATASNDELRNALSAGLAITSKMLAYLAKIWRELENRGEDLKALKSGLAVYLPLIGDEKLDPDVVVKFAGQKTVLNSLITLPIDEQRKLLDDGSIFYVTLTEHNERSVEEIPLTILGSTQAKQVIKDGRIVSPDEQFADLVQQKPARKTRNKRKVARKAVVEEANGDELLSVAGKRIKIDNLIHALSEHYGVAHEDINEVLKRK